MAYQSGLLNDFWTGYEQRRATGGRPLVGRELRNLLGPIMDYNLRREELAQERAQAQSNFERQIRMQEKAQEDAARASTISGAIQIPLAYGVAKQSGLLPKGFNLLSPTTWSGGANEGAGLFGGVAGLGSSYASTLPAAAPAGLHASLGVAESIAAPASTSASLLGTVGPPALGFLAGDLLSKVTGANKEISSTMKGVGIGAGIGSVIPGLGTIVGGAIGGAVGFISSLF